MQVYIRSATKQYINTQRLVSISAKVRAAFQYGCKGPRTPTVCLYVGNVEWSGVEWSGVEWSGVEWSGVEWILQAVGFGPDTRAWHDSCLLGLPVGAHYDS
jgi:hypothetical protein